MAETEEFIVFSVSVLIFFGILIYNPAKTYGVPAALVFIGIGLFFGNEYGLTPAYDYPQATELVSQLALNLIIFNGGLHTPVHKIRPVLREGLMLSNLTVLITAITLGVFVSYTTPLNLMQGLLLGAIISSTDAAAVFSILETKKLNLKHNTDKALEFESATNDPMAMILTMMFCSIIVKGGEIDYLHYSIFFLQQLSIGAVTAFIFALFLKFLFKHVVFKEKGLVPLFILTALFITTLGADFLGGNILVASYILGLMMSNTHFDSKAENMHFFNSTSWLAQALMFMLLGLQLFPARLLSALTLSMPAVFFLFFIARPLAVFVSYLPFKTPVNKRLFISLIGLKGATPIVFALMPLIDHVNQSELIFNIVSITVIASMIFHGFSLGWFAKKLNLLKAENATSL